MPEQEQDPANLTSFRLPGNPTEITIPSPLLNLVLLNTHIMKHAFGWGIGLRQLCDLTRAYHCLQTETDGKALYDLCRKAGIIRWNSLLHTFLVKQLGLPASSLPYPEKTVSPDTMLFFVPLLNRPTVIRHASVGSSLRVIMDWILLTMVHAGSRESIPSVG